MRSATFVCRRCARAQAASPLVLIQQATRKKHTSAQPQPTTSAPLHTSPPASTAGPYQPPHSSTTLFPSGSPVIVTPPSRFHLSPSEQTHRDACVAQHLHRQRRLQAAYENVDKSHLRVSFDLAYPHTSRQAATSLMTQLRQVAHTNRTVDYPATIHINALDPRALSTDQTHTTPDDEITQPHTPADSTTETAQHTSNFFVHEMRRCWSDSWLMHRTAATVAATFNTAEVVYLSPDSPNLLWRVTPHLVYVIGGLIDKHNIVPNVSLRAATTLQARTARLPIRECIAGGLRKSALNVDAVFALLMHVHQAAERIRHAKQQQQQTTSSVAAMRASASNGANGKQGWDALYGLQHHPRDVPFNVYKRPVFDGGSGTDEDIDWYRLWCEAFDAVVPHRLRWPADDQRIRGK